MTRLSHKTSWGDIKYYASGLNWQMVKTAQGYRKIWQSGGSFGFSSYCAVFPDLNVGIVLLSNESDQNSQGRLNTMADEILAGITLSGVAPRNDGLSRFSQNSQRTTKNGN